MLVEGNDGTYDCWAIDSPTRMRVDKGQGQSWYEGCAITAEQVPFVESSQLTCRILVEEGKVDVPSHTAGPKCIHTQEPIEPLSTLDSGI